MLQSSKSYYIVGYSFGALVALQLANLLEKDGYHGQLALIDGAPLFLKKLTLAALEGYNKNKELYSLLLSIIVNQIFPGESTESFKEIFLNLNTFKEKMAKFMEYIDKQNVYSREYLKTLVTAIFNRLQMVINYKLEEIEQIKSPITLIRPFKIPIQDIAEDYGLSKITKGKIMLKFIEGNHTSILNSPILAQYINDFDTAFQDKLV